MANPFETNILGQVPDQNPIMNPETLAGLGLGAGYVANQTGGQASTSGRLSSFAQKILQSDAARMGQRNLPNLIGQPQTTTPRLVGPSTPPQYTGPTPGRITPGTQVVPTGQAPAVRSVGGAPAIQPAQVTSVTTTTPTNRGASSYDYRVNTTRNPYGTGSRFSNLFKGLVKGAVGPVGFVTTPTEMGDGTLDGANRRAIEQGKPAPYPEAPGYIPQYEFLPNDLTIAAAAAAADAPQPQGRTPEEYRMYRAENPLQKPEAAPRLSISNLKEVLGSLFAESVNPSVDPTGQVPLNVTKVAPAVVDYLRNPDRPSLSESFSKPLLEAAPSASVAVEESTIQQPFTLPEGVEPGSPQAAFLTAQSQGQITPEQIAQNRALAESMGTTFDPETGYSRQPFLNAQGQAPQATSNAPMGVAETRARLQERFGGPTISSIQALPDGQGLGLRTDAQGRMITPGASRSDYEVQSDLRDQRVAARDIRSGESQTDRDTRIAQSRTQGSTGGGLSMADAVDLAGGDRKLARAMVVRSRSGLDPMTGKPVFEPKEIEIGGKKYIQMTPEYVQPIKEDTPDKTGLQSTLDNLQADLNSGRLTQEQYDIAVGNATNNYIGVKEGGSEGGDFDADGNYIGGGSQPSNGPKVGEVRGGHRFKGGDPSKQENWEKI